MNEHAVAQATPNSYSLDEIIDALMQARQDATVSMVDEAGAKSCYHFGLGDTRQLTQTTTCNIEVNGLDFLKMRNTLNQLLPELLKLRHQQRTDQLTTLRNYLQARLSNLEIEN